MRFLLVDDVAENLKLLSASLVGERHEVVPVRSGDDALQALQFGRFDAVISDILMPGMDGFRLCTEIRRGSRENACIPIVLYTSTYDSPADRALATEVGADYYLLKPAPVRQILAAVEEARQKAAIRVPHDGSRHDEPYILQKYNAALVRKLEARNTELNETMAALRESNEQVRTLNLDLEMRVSERTQKLAEANEQLEAFTHSVSHDLRTPLRAISGYLHMVATDESTVLSTDGRQLFDNIVNATRRMDALIDGLLAFSRASRTEMTLRVIDLGSLVDETLQALQFDLLGRNIEWICPRLPQVVGDRLLLGQVLVNLLGNAVKYTRTRDPARIEIGVSSQSDREVEIFIRDNGVGFDMRHAAHLFGVFRRLHSREEFDGSGIGLASAKLIVTRHGGSIRAEAAVDRGATFFLTLPRGA